MNVQVMSGSPRLLRNLNEKAVLQHLLLQGSLTRTELEAFTGLSKPAMSDLLKRLEQARLIRRAGEKAGTYGPKAGLWALEPAASYVAGVSVGAHVLDVAIADITGRLVTEYQHPRATRRPTPAGKALREALEETTSAAGLE